MEKTILVVGRQVQRQGPSRQRVARSAAEVEVQTQGAADRTFGGTNGGLHAVGGARGPRPHVLEVVQDSSGRDAGRLGQRCADPASARTSISST